ncbi:hypothetical protein [Niallia sp. 03133]|uniref:hypothetical protein n=1 Tax=Niallia sp. 03133 TaxID=3458060 RepID=UPI004044AEAD
MEQTHFYSEGMAPALAAKLAETLRVEREQIIVGNRSDEIIRLLTITYIEVKEEVYSKLSIYAILGCSFLVFCIVFQKLISDC